MSVSWIWLVVGLGAFLLLLYLTRSNTQYSKVLGPFPHFRFGQDEALDRAARNAVKSGLLLHNIPFSMRQGKRERIEVKISRSVAFRDQMLQNLRGEGEPQFEDIETSLYMTVELDGQEFEVLSYSLPEQLVIPSPACWEFYVTPRRSGQRQISLAVEMRIEAKGIVGGRRGVTVLNRSISVQVDVGYAIRSFATRNWQFLLATAIAIIGAVAAWLVV